MPHAMTLQPMIGLRSAQGWKGIIYSFIFIQVMPRLRMVNHQPDQLTNRWFTYPIVDYLSWAKRQISTHTSPFWLNVWFFRFPSWCKIPILHLQLLKFWSFSHLTKSFWITSPRPQGSGDFPWIPLSKQLPKGFGWSFCWSAVWWSKSNQLIIQLEFFSPLDWVRS